MNRIAFLIPYFGRFNDYFPLWLKSCAHNSDIADFFIISDIEYRKELPENVKFVKFTWSELVSHIQSFYDFPIGLKSPYGLCDYKCAYGEIFQDIIKGYSHWAYGDNDLIWGKWIDFLPNDWFDYDKLGNFGHLSIVKNSNEMKRLYRFNDAYKIAFSDNRNLFFDEKGFNDIVNVNHKKVYQFKIADCNPRKRKITPISELNGENSGLFIWDNGMLNHISIDKTNDKINKESVMYIHFLKRKMDVKRTGGEILLIHDLTIEEIDKIDGPLLYKLVHKCSKDRFYKEYWLKYLNHKQLINTIKSRIKPTSAKVCKIREIIMNK